MRWRRITWSPLTVVCIMVVPTFDAWIDRAYSYAVPYTLTLVAACAVWLLVPAKERM